MNRGILGFIFSLTKKTVSMATNNVPLTPQEELEKHFNQLNEIAGIYGKCSKDKDGSVTCFFKGIDPLNKQVKARVNVFIEGENIKAMYSFTGVNDQIMSPEAAIEKIAEQKNSISCEPIEPITFD